MALAVLGALGLNPTSLLSIANIGLSIHQYQQRQEALKTASNIKIIVGTPYGTPTKGSLSGNIPGVALWDSFGRQIGKTPGSEGPIKIGNSHEIRVKHDEEKVGNVRPSYISISDGGDDALCIAAVSMDFPDKIANVVLLGDMVVGCMDEQLTAWYPSNTIVTKDQGRPPCFWLDRNRDTPHQGIAIHIADILATEERAAQYVHHSGCDDFDFLVICFVSAPLRLATSHAGCPHRLSIA